MACARLGGARLFSKASVKQNRRKSELKANSDACRAPAGVLRLAPRGNSDKAQPGAKAAGGGP
jgi:hypothetical protein